MPKRIIPWAVDLAYDIAGCVLYAVAVNLFITPNQITPGGITGIATTLHYLFSLPSGLMVLLLNIPILMLGWKNFGGMFMVKTAVATVLFSAALEITELWMPPFLTDKIISAVFGGMLMGTGLSLVMLRGATTGGVDILAKLLSRRFRHLTVGRFVLLMDGVIIAFAAIAYRNLESALYSVVALYTSSRMMDGILYGADKGKMLYIVTAFPREICTAVNGRMHRGITVLNATGGYTGKARTVLLCTVRRHEVSALYRIIEEYDPHAFIVVSDVGEIIGEGFKTNS